MISIDVSKYLNNKAFDMEQCDQDAILYTLNMVQDCANQIFAEAADDESKMECFNEYLSNLSGMKKTLESMEIYVEYDWPGHRGEWFFPTYNEALDYEDWLFQIL